MEGQRIDPDELLKKVDAQAEAENRGQLKIFFGYAAGVGKTYAMLQGAQAAQKQGVDVVVGYLEPHTRPQTTALLAGLEQLPPKAMQYKSLVTNELDIDAALLRHPQLLIVDELAHTNSAQCRHTKRYQDVEELLKAGINVYTTVNVQHIESLNDIVSAVTGVMVRERIPDKIFDHAQQVELMDIEPQELIERLKRGKIYKEGQAQRALENFFTTENLAALREIALRRCADRLNRLLEKERSLQKGAYYTEEHILVCLSSSPTNSKIIRTAARMASAFKGRFTALFVETTALSTMSPENKNRLRSNIALAQQMGASIETVYGEDVAFQIAEFSRLSAVSKIVVGRSTSSRKGFFRGHSLTEKLTAAAPSLDIHIIPDHAAMGTRPPKQKAAAFHLQPVDIVKSLAILVVVTLIGFVFSKLGFSEANIITFYILGVLITAVVTSHRLYSLVSSLVSVLTFNFFFTVPRFTLQAYDAGYPVTFFIMFLAAFITGTLAVKIKQSAQQSAQTAYRTKILLETNQLLQKAQDRASVITLSAKQLALLVRRDVIFYAVENHCLQQPVIFPSTDAPPTQDCVSENERAVAAWVLQNNRRAGASTNTLCSAKCLYLAVRVNENVYGVVGIVMPDEPLEPLENSLVLSIIGECALALENQQILAEREEAAVLAKNEQLRANLLRSISHDLRTPLTSISGNAGILISSGEALSEEKRQTLYTDIYDDSLWLIGLVENLLSVTRIEDGTMRLRLTAELLEEVITEALSHIGRKGKEHQLIVEPSNGFVLARMDARLIVQVVINLVDNAIKYTPKGSEIRIRTVAQQGFASISVSDTGEGITDEAKPKIFDMFFTDHAGVADSRRSLGLGLALCKSIINAHGGSITVADNLPKGTVFTFTLPLEEMTLHE